jgi:uncharacterized protein YvpB
LLSFYDIVHTRNQVSVLICGSVNTAVPAFLTFTMRHSKKMNGKEVHCVIVVGVDAAGIQTIDSLGRREKRRPNSTISSQRSVQGWPAAGAPLIVTRDPARMLLGLPSLRSAALGGGDPKF